MPPARTPRLATVIVLLPSVTEPAVRKARVLKVVGARFALTVMFPVFVPSLAPIRTLLAVMAESSAVEMPSVPELSAAPMLI